MARAANRKRSAPTQELIETLDKHPEKRDVVINWSRRGGKTHTAISDIILPFSYYVQDCRISYITTTLKHAKDIAWTSLLSELGPLVKNKNIGEGRITLHNAHGGSSILQLMGWQTIDSIRGTANDIVIYDETQLLGDFFSNHNTAVMPTMATTKGRRFYLFTPLGFNHAYELAEEAKKNPLWHYSEATWDKFKHIDKSFIEAERARMTEAEFVQEYMCKFIKPDGLVLSEFQHDIHVFEEEIIGQPHKILVGLDFGYGNGNTAIITAYITKNEKGQDVYWITDELYKRGSELQTFEIAELIAQQKPTRVHADSADPSRINDLMRTGLPVVPIKKSNNYKIGPNGLISRVNQAFAQDRVRVKKSCVNLLSEMNMWFWNVQKDIVRPDKSTKHDAIDAMLYLIGANEETVRPTKIITNATQIQRVRRYNPISL